PVIRHARKDRLLASFEKNVWSLRFRCASCHAPGGAEYAKLTKEHGPRVGWLKADAAATMQHVMGGRLVDKKAPEKSLLLLKALNEVKHGGGQKMLRGDLGYQAYRRWLEDYADVVGGKYKKASDLPPRDAGPERFGTEVWLKLDQTPPAWADKLLRVSVYAWDAKAKAWEK